ncbi:Flp family type IVb pilin [Kiloniella majae]|uniref:Flp family type IVb pilin n=1 Tax=Kiloniella majae TaxID=1938558 RepID=UPI000A279571|nr:Flp family type IVb pilin [Kiloniella majae]
MTNFTKNFLADESGATAIEYGLIAALVSVAAILTLEALGSSLNEIFGVAKSSLDDAAKAAKTS